MNSYIQFVAFLDKPTFVGGGANLLQHRAVRCYHDVCFLVG